MDACLDDGLVHFGDLLEGLTVGAGDHFLHFREGVEGVAGVDALGRVAHLEVFVEGEGGVFLQQGDTFLFGAAGVDGGFVDDVISFLKMTGQHLRGREERLQVGQVVVVDGCGDGDDMKTCFCQLVRVGGESDVPALKSFGRQFLAGVDAPAHLFHAVFAYVKTYHGKMFRQLQGDGQAHVSQSHDGDLRFSLFQLLNHIVRIVKFVL